MATLIDGYNLLHVTGVFSDAVGPGAVEKLHAALLDFLLAHLEPKEIPRTTVVFDARGRRAKSRRSLKYAELTVHYSNRSEDADALITELIDQDTSPRQLTVVSSDHQVQRSARRRRATAVDSDVWYAELMRRHRQRLQAAEVAEDSARETLGTLFPPEYLAEIERELAKDHKRRGGSP